MTPDDAARLGEIEKRCEKATAGDLRRAAQALAPDGNAGGGA